MSNMLNISTWTVGTGSPTYWTRMGADDNNYRRYATDPWGKQTLLWECIETDTVANSYGGGWNSTTHIYIDPTKRYRFSVWVNRTVFGHGNFYLGTNEYSAAGSNRGLTDITSGANNNNAYFYYGSAILEGEWFLVVGHIHPYDYNGTALHADSGIWRFNTKTKYGTINREFKWRSDSARTIHRSFLYNSINPATRQFIFYPRIELCDGTEPSIQQLMRNGTYQASFNIGVKYLSIQAKDVIDN